ncbi:hypothetical protein [Bartonella phoceensis]|uniref:hypothetical protein n=1 Tax=Bartonella phoceensis TaxID=270249 RepID=UPI001ABA495A|nr:hypothetical protein [Bartonella phoceensis]
MKINNAVVIGADTEAKFLERDGNLLWGTVIGYNAQAYRSGSVAIGSDAIVTKDGVDGIAVVGPYARVVQQGALGLGYGANGSGETSIAIGYASQAT